MMQNWIFSIITPVFSVMILQKSFWYNDLLLKKHLLLWPMLKLFHYFILFILFHFLTNTFIQQVKTRGKKTF